MTRPPKLPDLGQLTEAQKDELIVNLWETLVAVDGTGDLPSPAGAAPTKQTRLPANETTSARDLREWIRSTAPSRRAQARAEPPARLGRSFRFLESKLLLTILMVIGLGFLADFGVGWYQRRAVIARDQAALVLRNAAFTELYVELLRVAYEPDGKSYRATLNMQNTTTIPLYIMFNAARVFVQTGLTWQEIPSQANAATNGGVVKLDGAREYSIVFQADLTDWSQLIPGYMHVLIASDMLISRSSEPKDDIVERNNRFYVYLKPQGSDDAAIKRRSNFPGTPPVFIPMPPH